MRHQSAVPSTSVRPRRSLSANLSTNSSFGFRFVRTAFLLATAGFAGLAGSGMAAAKNAGKDAGATGTPPIKVPATPEHWQTESGSFEKIQGMDAIAMHEGG